jgi:signal peptidase II
MTPRLAAFSTAVFIFLLDRVTKLLVDDKLRAWDTIPIIPGVFNLVHAENPGAAFSMLAQAPEQLRRFFLIGVSSIVMLILVALIWRLPQGTATINWIALGLILGGALGNLYDRALRGTVTDFLQVFLGSYEWPSFNVADSAISVGACLILLDMWIGRPRHVS